MKLLIAILLGFAASASAETISLNSKDWHSLSYSKIPPNKVTNEASGLKVAIDKSAGPLVYKLQAPIKLTHFRVKGKLIGKKKKEDGKFDDDSVMRMGFVATGDQKLTGVKSWFAADWVKELFKLAPKDSGLDKIYFFNATDRKEMVGQKRQHPSSDLIHEDISWHVEEPGAFTLTKKLDPPIDTAALWVSIDGDDTKSKFEVVIESIQLNPAANKETKK